MRYYQAEAAAKHDFRELKSYRRIIRDKRRKKRTLEDRLGDYYCIKKMQFDLALHRKQLRSPFDYEYPRMDQMNALARELYDRHLKAWSDYLSIKALIETVQWAVRKNSP